MVKRAITGQKGHADIPVEVETFTTQYLFQNNSWHPDNRCRRSVAESKLEKVDG